MNTDEYINQAEELLQKLPRKPDTNKLKGKESQLKLLTDEYEYKTKQIKKNYESFFKDIVESMGKNHQKELIKTRELLSTELRLKQAIAILKKIRKEDEKQANESTIRIADESDFLSIKLSQIIKNGENNNVEFKSSLRWDHEKNEKNRNLEIAIIKTICAFLNTSGGILLIGIDDNGKVMGLENDYQLMKRKDGDGFIQYLIQILNNMLGKQNNRFVSASIRKVENREVCMINVEKSPYPIFIKYDNNEEFYIRASSTSQPLNVKESYEYIRSHWSK